MAPIRCIGTGLGEHADEIGRYGVLPSVTVGELAPNA
jgi:hypothetical protein